MTVWTFRDFAITITLQIKDALAAGTIDLSHDRTDGVFRFFF